MVPLAGAATPEGTRAFAARHGSLSPAHWRAALGLELSSIGMGTYLGAHTREADERYEASVEAALDAGCNAFDTAINYRCMRSERAIGAALRRRIESGRLRREEVFVCTKGGFIPFDGSPPADPPSWFEKMYVSTGLIRPAEIVSGSHCIAPRFIENQIETSRRNLALDTIDLYYLHNPETQLEEVDVPELLRRLEAAFRALEEAAARGKIRFYGLATWDGLRVPPGRRSHLPLEKIVALARGIAGDAHRFRAVQLPFNLAMMEALLVPSQPTAAGLVPALEAAREFGLVVFTSVPLLQARLLGSVPAEVRRLFAPLETDAQCALQFARSAPGVTVALAGMSRPEHVRENLQAARVPPLAPEVFRSLLA